MTSITVSLLNYVLDLLELMEEMFSFLLLTFNLLGSKSFSTYHVGI